jgi:tRNA pseudouridine55 synthase
MTGRKEDQRSHGLLVVDKPRGVTSRDAVNAIQRRFPPRTRVGHTGTLDPLATGVLVICVGQATRLAEYIQDLPKTYRATIRLGATSTTDDSDGEISERTDVTPLNESVITQVLPQFVGEIEQVPPVYSAIKQDGQRAYELARTGQAVVLHPRRVRIDAIRLRQYRWPFLELEIDCGKGTYIRALARDLGQALRVGGMISELRRIRVGPFDESLAIPWSALNKPSPLVLRSSTEAVAHLPRCDVSEAEFARLQQGQSIRRAVPAGDQAIFMGNQLVAMGRSDGSRVHPVKVFGVAV